MVAGKALRNCTGLVVVAFVPEVRVSGDNSGILLDIHFVPSGVDNLGKPDDRNLDAEDNCLYMKMLDVRGGFLCVK